MEMQTYSIISLGGIWFLFFWLYRDYRLDKFREDLFSLRDELFDLALNEGLDFNSKAYGYTRSYINSTIRNGHRFGLFELLFFYIFMRSIIRFRGSAAKIDESWDELYATQAKGVQTKLKSIRTRMHLIMVEQLIFSSIILTFLIVPVIMWVILMKMKRLFTYISRNIFVQKLVKPLISFLDVTAYIFEEDEGSISGPISFKKVGSSAKIVV